MLPGSFPAGTVVNASWTGVTVNTPCGQYGYAVEFSTTPSSSVPPETRFPVQNQLGAISMTTVAAATELAVNVFTDGYCSGGTLRGLLVQVQTPSTNPCQYGTRLQPAGTFLYYLTPGLIDTWAVAVGLPWLAPLFTAFYFTTYNAQTLCGAGPPPMPAIDLHTWEASVVTLKQILDAIAWPNLCECVPGTPSPIPFPPPNATQPTGWPTQPTFSCTNSDICTTLLQLQHQVAAIQATVGEDLGLTTLLQRYSLPFAYIKGARHSNLVGSGSFQTSRLIGVDVEIVSTATPPRLLQGNPPYVWDMGWLSVSNGDGMLQEKRLTRDRFVWLPPSMQTAQLFGWWLHPGVTIAVTELEAEP